MSLIRESQNLKLKRDERDKIHETARMAEKKQEHRKLVIQCKKRLFDRYHKYQKYLLNKINEKRHCKLSGKFYAEGSPEVVFAVRIKGINKIPPKPRLILRLFRLLQLHNGVFIRINAATQQMLQIISPYITYGPLSLGTIRKLVYKRGYGKVGVNGSRQGQRVRLSDPSVLQGLSKMNVYSLEDIVYELATCGENFKQISNFLWPFKLKSPKGGLTKKRHGFNEYRKGEWGYRANYMGRLVRRMI